MTRLLDSQNRVCWVLTLSLALLACGPQADVTGPGTGNGSGGGGGDGGAAVHTLTVNVTGGGLVTSSPAGIDCGTKCSATFPEGTAVTLSWTAASGSNLTAWTGACSGTSSCVVVLNTDATVGATFVVGAPPPPPPPPAPPPPPPPPPPPAPSEECADLVPASLPAPVTAQLSDHPIDGPCLSGVSDDGDATFLLGFVNGRFAPPRNEYDFFRIDAGGAARVGNNSVVGGDGAPVRVLSQPSGFSSFQVSGDTGGSVLRTWSHDGTTVSFTQLTPSDFTSNHHAEVGIDPSGGTAAVRTNRTGDGRDTTTYQRFDKTGVAETGEVPIDSGGGPRAGAPSGPAPLPRPLP